MIVWGATHLDIACEDDHIVGIFSTKEKAQEALIKAGAPDNKPWSIEIDKITLEDDEDATSLHRDA